MNFEKLRNKMVDEQIRARGITDASMLEVMRRIPRHEFVLNDYMKRAYDDCPVPIGEGQTISQPYMVALMTQCLELNKEKKVLEIGLGSGYQTAILAELSKEVYSIERVKILFERATQILQKLSYKNVQTFFGDGAADLCIKPQLFDAIMITAASPQRPDYLFPQLAPLGRLVVPIGDRHNQILTLITKINDQIVEKAVCDCTFVPLIGEYGWPLN